MGYPAFPSLIGHSILHTLFLVSVKGDPDGAPVRASGRRPGPGATALTRRSAAAPGHPVRRGCPVWRGGAGCVRWGQARGQFRRPPVSMVIRRSWVSARSSASRKPPAIDSEAKPWATERTVRAAWTDSAPSNP